MCAGTFCPTCPPILPCGEHVSPAQWPCRYSCPPPPPCCKPCCPPPIPCTPCPPCRCCTQMRQCPAPILPDLVPPIVPVLPVCKPRRPMRYEEPLRPTPCVYYPPVLPPQHPPECGDPPPCCWCPEPVICVPPVLPPCNPQCPPTIVPKQRAICPRPLQAPYPPIPVGRSSCPVCETDPVTRRRPLIVHDSVFVNKPSGLPGECLNRRNPNVRYTCANYVAQGPQSGCWYNVHVPLR